MSDGLGERAGTNDWGGLLAQTRQALSTLRAEDLEDLAARAERLLAGLAWPQTTPELYSADRVKLAREHRLLGDLLVATGDNLEVLRRQRERRNPGEAREGNRRWAR